MSNYYSGLSFPFRFNASGGTTGTSLTPDDTSLIIESLRQIWFTSKNERLMEVEFGSTVEQYLFEPNGDITELAILRHEMMKAAEEYEDRIVINDIRFIIPEDASSTTLIYVDCTITKFMLDTTLVLDAPLNNT